MDIFNSRSLGCVSAVRIKLYLIFFNFNSDVIPTIIHFASNLVVKITFGSCRIGLSNESIVPVLRIWLGQSNGKKFGKYELGIRSLFGTNSYFLNFFLNFCTVHFRYSVFFSVIILHFPSLFLWQFIKCFRGIQRTLHYIANSKSSTHAITICFRTWYPNVGNITDDRILWQDTITVFFTVLLFHIQQ